MTPLPAPERSRGLDALRGVAILMVVFYHLYVVPDFDFGWSPPSALKRLCGNFGAGVDIFFTLSGFLIGGILLKEHGSPGFHASFFRRRALRILPLYFLLLCSWAVALFVVNSHAAQWGPWVDGAIPLWSYPSFLQNILMVQLRDLGPPWMVVTWSLAIEVQIYFLLPFMVGRMSAHTLRFACGAAAVGAPLIRYAFIAVAENPFGPLFHTLSRCDGIMIGVGLATLTRNPRFMDRLTSHRAKLLAAAWLASATFLACSWVARNHLKLSFVFTPTIVSFGSALTILSLLQPSKSAAPRSGVVETLAFFGDISYFTYLFHLPVLYTLVMSKTGGLHARELALAGVISLGALSFRLIEKPIMALGRSARSSNGKDIRQLGASTHPS